MEQQMETGWSGTAGVNLALPVVKRMSIVQGMRQFSGCGDGEGRVRICRCLADCVITPRPVLLQLSVLVESMVKHGMETAIEEPWPSVDSGGA